MLFYYLKQQTNVNSKKEKKIDVKYRRNDIDRRAFEKFSKSIIDDRKKRASEGLAVIYEDADKWGLLSKVFPPTQLSTFSLCSIALLPHDALQRRMHRKLARSLKCFYRHVLSRMNHYEYATVSILLAFRDYRRASLMHMREARIFIQTFPSQ